MRATTFPELIQLKAPEGTQDAVRQAANREGQSSSEFVRQAIRAQIRRIEPERELIDTLVNERNRYAERVVKEVEGSKSVEAK